MTWSPFLMRCIRSLLEHFRSERDDLHELRRAQLASDRPENARADRLELVRQKHRGVAVEADQRAVGSAQAVPRAHDDRVVHLALLDAPARNRVLDRDLDDVADLRVAALRAAEHPDTHQAACAAIVRGIQHGLGLDHDRPLRLGLDRGPLDDLDDAPGLALADRTAFDDRDRVACAARAFLVVRHDLRGPANELAVGRVLDQALDRHGDALLHLVADDATDRRPMRGFIRAVWAHDLYSLLLHALALQGLQARDRLAHFAVLVGLCAVAGSGLHAQVELLAAQLQQLLGELGVGFLAERFSLFLDLHQPGCRSTKVVLSGSFAAASVNASRATSSVTPAIS